MTSETDSDFDEEGEDWTMWESNMTLWPVGGALLMVPLFGWLINSYVLP